MKKAAVILFLCVAFISNRSHAQMITDIKTNTGLLANGWLKSANGVYLLMLQKDGNFVLSKAGVTLWSTNTAGKPITQAFMNVDGNFVLKGADGKVYWSTNTGGHPGSSLRIKDDGNICVREDIYATDYMGNPTYVKSVGVWYSNTAGK